MSPRFMLCRPLSPWGDHFAVFTMYMPRKITLHPTHPRTDRGSPTKKWLLTNRMTALTAVKHDHAKIIDGAPFQA